MREKYESLALAVLKDLAKARGIKITSAMKKADVVEAMLKKDEEEKAEKSEKTANVEKLEQSEDTSAEDTEKKPVDDLSEEKRSLDSGIEASGILEVLSEGYGFIRSDNYLPGEGDVYVAPSQIRRFSLKTGDIVVGNTRVKNPTDKFGALLFVKSINGMDPELIAKRPNFEDLTPIFPNCKLSLERPGCSVAMREWIYSAQSVRDKEE